MDATTVTLIEVERQRAQDFGGLPKFRGREFQRRGFNVESSSDMNEPMARELHVSRSADMKLDRENVAR